jgi:hypothetical protein
MARRNHTVEQIISKFHDVALSVFSLPTVNSNSTNDLRKPDDCTVSG